MICRLLFKCVCILLLPAVLFCTGCLVEKAPQKYPYILATEQFTTSFMVLNPNVDILSPEAIVWRYNPAVDWDIENKHLRAFRNPSDAKIVQNGSKLLFTTSGGVCGLIDLTQKKLDWLVFANGNPHSAELLPDGNAVTVSSIGSYLMLFDLKKDIKGSISKKYILKSAHGVVWDNKNQLLYACGRNGVVSYKYDPEKVELTPVREYNLDLPERIADAHDLIIDPVDGKLLVTVTRGLLKLDQITGAFEVITPHRRIKSVSVVPEIGIMIVMAEKGTWWSDKLRRVDSRGAITDFIRMPHMHFYKARWISDSENIWLKNK